MALQHPFTSRQLHTHRNVRYFVLAILSVHNLYANENNKGKEFGRTFVLSFQRIRMLISGWWCVLYSENKPSTIIK